ncbi:uncharacterized protein [Apostichopus japonicus]|uniref:uncharacterized protein n=1 Tax=Stichopus japonicus TaxID=307972 RepID=UPI003AB71402
MKTRSMAGIAKQNPYLFASTQNSDYHVSGWHAVHRVCDKLEFTRGNLLTATKNRHRLSTMYASMEVPEAGRRFFYSHMGHSKEMNQDIYQAPLALMEVIKVGRSLNEIDGASGSGAGGLTSEAEKTSNSSSRRQSKGRPNSFISDASDEDRSCKSGPESSKRSTPGK